MTTISRLTVARNALRVIALDPRIRAWLKANDPKALDQVERAGEIRPDEIARAEGGAREREEA